MKHDLVSLVKQEALGSPRVASLLHCWGDLRGVAFHPQASISSSVNLGRGSPQRAE